MITNNFVNRHNGPRGKEVEKMLQQIGVASIDELIDQTIPKSIRLAQPLDNPKGINEYEFMNHIKQVAAKNKIFRSFIGLGYYGPIRPKFRRAASKLCSISKLLFPTSRLCPLPTHRCSTKAQPPPKPW